MEVKLINKDEIENELELAGWIASVSSDFDADTPAKKLRVAKHCIESNHGTVTRPMRFVFEISGCSRTVSHELVRHELGVAKCQRSQRYVSEDGFNYVTPDAIRNTVVDVGIVDANANIIGEFPLEFCDVQHIVRQWYNGAVKQGVKPEDARYVLTNATHTKFRLTFDWEALVNFCRKRRCARAQKEIRDLADTIAKEVTESCEYLGQFLTPPCEFYGFCQEKNSCGKYPKREEALAYLKTMKRGG